MAAPPPPTVNGTALQHASARIISLSRMPIAQQVNMRNGRTPLQTRVNQEEAYLGQERGDIMAPSCEYCNRGLGPFVGCVVIDGMIKESCMNCHYGGTAAQCTHRQNCENAIAFLTAQNVPAPNVNFTTPANYFGGTLGGVMPPISPSSTSRNRGGVPVTVDNRSTPAPETPNRQPPRRIAPTPIDTLGTQVATPSTTPARVRTRSPDELQEWFDEAKCMTRQERNARRSEIALELAALARADAYDGEGSDDNGGGGSSNSGGAADSDDEIPESEDDNGGERPSNSDRVEDDEDEISGSEDDNGGEGLSNLSEVQADDDEMSE